MTATDEAGSRHLWAWVLAVFAVALALPLIPLSEGMRTVTVYGFIYIGWANTVFSTCSMVSYWPSVRQV